MTKVVETRLEVPGGYASSTVARYVWQMAGSQRIFDVEWMLYHLAERLSGHFGQILPLRHLYGTTQAKV